MKLIDKDALVAEIEKLVKDAELYLKYNSDDDSLYEIYKHQKAMMLDLLNKVDAFEVKEVDLELGIKKSVNESIIRKIVDLNEESGKHYDAVIKKEREENGFSQLAIDLFDHKVDINELRIQYIIENLKAQKGE